ncbi:hypothetical protein [Streptomyces sp. CA-132043]|uniref:hypothetical protein n=1 Tax=Streptomyces sp. CA-132043 TaxID=3240048 RepID=UPI003D939BAF
MAGTAGPNKTKYQPNRLASRLIDALAGPVRYWFGTVTIFGYHLGEDGNFLPRGLSDSQRNLIGQVYVAPWRPLHTEHQLVDLPFEIETSDWSFRTASQLVP